MELGILTMDDFDFQGRTVILRVDINSPIDPQSKALADDTRIRKCVPTIAELADAGARVVLLAHQGDIEDYHNLISLEPHGERLSELLSPRRVEFIDDIAGPAATTKIKSLSPGDILLLNNVRYLTEEVSTFINFVKLSPKEMAEVRLVRNLAPLADYYVCEAFSAAHRASPSLIGFAEVLPAAAGRLFMEELKVLTKIKENPQHPCIYVLGGARPGDAFSMMEEVLSKGSADQVLTCGLVGEIMLLGIGQQLGQPTERLIFDRGLSGFVAQARELYNRFRDRIVCPLDVAVEENGQRRELAVEDLPTERLIIDIGSKTIEYYKSLIDGSATIFVNGPVGMFEKPAGSLGTQQLWSALANASGYSVIGGGHTIAAAALFGIQDKVDYVCTAGGCMIRFLSGKQLPVLEALRHVARRYFKEQNS